MYMYMYCVSINHVHCKCVNTPTYIHVYATLMQMKLIYTSSGVWPRQGINSHSHSMCKEHHYQPKSRLL